MIGVDDDEFGKRLAAFVVVAPGQTLRADEVRELRQATTWPATRSRATSIFLDELPRNPTGKVLKRALRERTSSLA